MNTDAASYIREIVEPTIADFRDHPASRRHAFLACVVTFHCIDYLTRRPQNLRNEYRRDSPDFAIVDRVAHAFKHERSGNPNSPQNQPLHASSVFERPPATAGIAQCGLSRVGDSTGSVEIWSEEGSDLLRAVTNAAEFLRRKM